MTSRTGRTVERRRPPARYPACTGWFGAVAAEVQLGKAMAVDGDGSVGLLGVEPGAPGVLESDGRSRRQCKSSHLSGRPLRSWSPRVSNSMPEPSTRSRTIADTSTSPGRRARRRGRPRASLCRPSRHLSPRTLRCADRRGARVPGRSCRQRRHARTGRHEQAHRMRSTKPSPVVFTSRPRNRRSSRRVRASCSSSSRRHR